MKKQSGSESSPSSLDAPRRLGLLGFKRLDDSEGGGDGVSSPRTQTDHIPNHSVQLLVCQPPLLACNSNKGHLEKQEVFI